MSTSTSSATANQLIASGSTKSLPTDKAPNGRGGRGGNRKCRGRGDRGGGRGRGGGPATGIGPASASATPKLTRPTHFLALPLHTFTDLRMRIAKFQDALFEPSPSTSSEASVSLGHSPQPVSSASTSNAITEKLNSLSIRDEKKNPTGKGKRTVKTSFIVEGLDNTIVIDPTRMHMTLGIMALELDDFKRAEMSAGTPPQPETLPAPSKVPIQPTPTSPLSQPSSTDSAVPPTPTPPLKTVTTALTLLRSLQSQISTILEGNKGVDVPLEVMHVLKTSRMKPPRPKPIRQRKPKRDPEGEGEPANATDASGVDEREKTREGDETESAKHDQDGVEPIPDKLGAGVLFIGPKELHRNEESEARRKLREVCDLIYDTFRKEGYITDTRPLKLHCTILNASHRKPARRTPFAYSDILSSGACSILRGNTKSMTAANDGGGARSHSQSEADLAVGPPSSEKATPGQTSPAPMGDIVAEVIPTEATDASSALPSTGAIIGTTPPKPRYRPPLTVLPPLPIDLGTYRVNEVQLWVMGSHGKNNEYVNCGGVRLE